MMKTTFKLSLALLSVITVSSAFALPGELFIAPETELMLSPARYTYEIQKEESVYPGGAWWDWQTKCNTATKVMPGIPGKDFTIFHGDLNLLAKMKVISKGQYIKSGVPANCTQYDSPVGRHGMAFLIKNSQPYAADNLTRTHRLENLYAIPESMNISRWEKKTGLAAQFMAGSFVSDEYYELIETKQKKIVIEWNAEESFDDFYEMQFTVAYRPLLKTWAMTPVTANTAWPVTTIEETDDTINVSITKMVKAELLQKGTKVEILKVAGKGVIKVDAPILSLTGAKIETMNLKVTANGKVWAVILRDEKALIEQGFITREGTVLMIPAATIKRVYPKFNETTLTTGKVKVDGDISARLLENTYLSTENFTVTVQN